MHFSELVQTSQISWSASGQGAGTVGEQSEVVETLNGSSETLHLPTTGADGMLLVFCSLVFIISIFKGIKAAYIRDGFDVKFFSDQSIS